MLKVVPYDVIPLDRIFRVCNGTTKNVWPINPLMIAAVKAIGRFKLRHRFYRCPIVANLTALKRCRGKRHNWRHRGERVPFFIGPEDRPIRKRGTAARW